MGYWIVKGVAIEVISTAKPDSVLTDKSADIRIVVSGAVVHEIGLGVRTPDAQKRLIWDYGSPGQSPLGVGSQRSLHFFDDVCDAS